MNRFVWLIFCGSLLHGQDAREVVSRSVDRDQANWRRMKDYTWTIFRAERVKGKPEQTEEWETVMIAGEPYHRRLRKNGKDLSPADQRKEQEKLDRAFAKVKEESPSRHAKRLAEAEKQRVAEREFLAEIPEAYQFHLDGEDKIDGREVWIISAVPRPGFKPKHSDAKVLGKVEGRVWIDKTEYQWVKIDAHTTGTISYGLFLARLAAGAKLTFEQTRINNELWLPRHAVMSGSARLALIKGVSVEEDITWKNYRKFQVESNIITSDK